MIYGAEVRLKFPVLFLRDSVATVGMYLLRCKAGKSDNREIGYDHISCSEKPPDQEASSNSIS